MSQAMIGRIDYRFEATRFHPPVAIYSWCRYHKPFHLDDGGCDDPDRQRWHAELVDCNIPSRAKIAPGVPNVQCIQKGSTVRKVKSALCSIIREHCKATVIQSQVTEATIQRFPNICRTMPCLSAMEPIQFSSS